MCVCVCVGVGVLCGGGAVQCNAGPGQSRGEQLSVAAHDAKRALQWPGARYSDWLKART